MIENLKQIEDKMLLELLAQPDKWNSLIIDKAEPIVERCWTQIGNYRIHLQFVHKCETKDALYHKHPWPSAVHILYGRYEMGLGINHNPGFKELTQIKSGNIEDPTVRDLSTESKYYAFLREIYKVEHEGDNYFEMLARDGWHYVRPKMDVCAMVMLTGRPWGKINEFEKEEEKEVRTYSTLSMQKKLIMLKWFEDYYINKVHNKKIIENDIVKRGDWVRLDVAVMTINDKRGLEIYIGKIGFVIGRDKNFIDVRFGNDRTRVHARLLTMLEPGERPTSKPESHKEIDDIGDDWGVKKKNSNKIDHMDPSLWPDDDKDI